MQIFDVKVIGGPKNGKFEIVGSGFRYASNDSDAPDKFTLLVAGKNKRTDGTSTIEVDANPVQSVAQPTEPKSQPVEAVSAATLTVRNGNANENTLSTRLANSEASAQLKAPSPTETFNFVLQLTKLGLEVSILLHAQRSN